MANFGAILHNLNFIKKGRVIIIYFRGAVAQSVDRATPAEEVPSSIPAVAVRSLLDGSVSV